MTHAASIALSGFDENSDDVPKEMSVAKDGREGMFNATSGPERSWKRGFLASHPQDELPQPRMTVAAHDQEIG